MIDEEHFNSTTIKIRKQEKVLSVKDLVESNYNFHNSYCKYNNVDCLASFRKNKFKLKKLY